MTPEQFVYWLQGHCEMNPDQNPTVDQWVMVQDHLKTVFKKETKPLGLGKMQWPLDNTTPVIVPYVQPYTTPTIHPQIIC